MIPAEIIRRKRDGLALTGDEIASFVRGYASGEVADYQMAALAMAICIRGMSSPETVHLTQEMLGSGTRLRRTSEVPRVDKHSTGGLGDKVSLVLAPLLACCGLQVPMISGRGLGITGGTLDKLEAIPGYRTALSQSEIEAQTERVGCVICGATAELAPVDRKLYALRDVTATVESIPLITASILSKKLAESLDSLVLDVKVGSGAFMKTLDQARDLARTLVRVATGMGVRTTALLTEMHQPLGRAVGNAVEVRESIELLQGGGPDEVRGLTLALGAELLVATGRVTTPQEATIQLVAALDSGRAFEKFAEMVSAQGGRLGSLTVAPASEVTSDREGCVREVHGAQLGRAIIQLRGGHLVLSDRIDHSVGLEMLVRIGQTVSAGQPLARVFATEAAAAHVRPWVREAIVIDEVDSVPAPPLIYERLTAE